MDASTRSTRDSVFLLSQLNLNFPEWLDMGGEDCSDCSQCIRSELCVSDTMQPFFLPDDFVTAHLLKLTRTLSIQSSPSIGEHHDTIREI